MSDDNDSPATSSAKGCTYILLIVLVLTCLWLLPAIAGVAHLTP